MEALIPIPVIGTPMTTRERLVIYSVLMTLVIFNLNFLLGTPASPGSSGFASIGGQAAYAEPMRRGNDLLGPTDGVVLAGEDGGEDLTLVNKNGRPSWGDEPYQRTHAVAFVHIGKILNHQLSSDAYEEDRAILRDEYEEQEQEYTDQLKTLNEQIQGLGEDDPDRQIMLQKGSKLYQQFQQWMQQMSMKQDSMAAKHLEDAYRELVTAVDIVADRMGIDLIYRFIPTDAPFKARALEQATMAIRLRPVLRYPEGLDITLEVMEELSLDFE